MRKKIAVHIGEIGGTFQKIIMKVITTKANALGYDVMAFCSYGSYNDDILYAEGEKASIYLPDPTEFDGIIVTEDLFDIPGMGDELYEKLRKEAKCPVVYLRSIREAMYCILVENRVSMEQMVRHFVEDHGFTDICYMSGKHDSFDSQERLRGFYNVMREKNIPVTEHMVYHGDFWRERAVEALDWFMRGRSKYPQAIICANDYMALSICDELKNRGIRVPEDVCVSGFDFVDEAENYEPTLTSLQVDFAGMSARAVEIIDNVNHGIQEEKIQRMPAKLVLRKSCGCGEQRQLGEVASLYIDENYRKTANMKNSMLQTMEYQDSIGTDEFMAVADKYRVNIQAEKAYFCFVDVNEQGFDSVENVGLFTDRMLLTRIFDITKRASICNTEFSRKKLLPDEYWKEDEPNNFYFFVIHFKNYVYGYMVAENPMEHWFDIFTQSYLLNLATAIENTKLQTRLAKLEEIRSLYQKDELTGIYNRRGFDRLLREKFANAKENNENIGIVSIDMDNLKIINDNYGHTVGDLALQTVATALDSVMAEGEYCARVGGDEFAAVIDIKSPERVQEFKESFAVALKKRGELFSDFEVVASVGICELAEVPGATLMACVKRADSRMYEEKRARKAGRQS